MKEDEIRASVEGCHTDDGIDRGRHHIEGCFWAVIEKCMEIFEKRMEREE